MVLFLCTIQFSSSSVLYYSPLKKWMLFLPPMNGSSFIKDRKKVAIFL